MATNPITITSPEHDNDSINIELALPSDASKIMEIKRAAWMKAYVSPEHGVTEQTMDLKFSDQEFREGVINWEKGIASEDANPNKQTYVARLNSEVVGYVSPIKKQGQSRIGALYVSPDCQGRGIGTSLINQAIEFLGRDQDIAVHVVSYNQPAINFYEKIGFQKTRIVIPEENIKEDTSLLLPEIEMVLKKI